MWSVLAIALVLAALRSTVGPFLILLVGLGAALIAVVFMPAFIFFLWLRATDRLDLSTMHIKGRLNSRASILGSIVSLAFGLVMGCSIGGLLAYLAGIAFESYFD
jgi:hypothetical protein